MATPLTAAKVLAALKAEGVSVQEYKDWRNHNRNHKGLWGGVNGVVIHHTVSSADDSSVALCYNGHSSLPGPLCHGVGRNDGKIALVGHGRANHAGLGDDDVLRAVINETTLPADNEANTDGNRHFYGLEIVNLGDGKDTYPWVQYVAAVKWATAHCRAHGWGYRSVIGHKEWQPGKIDPKGPVIGPDGKKFEFTMDRFRADVKAALALPAGEWNGKTAQVPSDEGWEQVGAKELVSETRAGIAPNTAWSLASYVGQAYESDNEVRARLAALEAKVDKLIEALEK